MNSIKNNKEGSKNFFNLLSAFFWVAYCRFFQFQIHNLFGSGENLYLKLRFGFINEAFEPIRCEKCGSTNSHDQEQQNSTNSINETLRECKSCNQLLGKYSFGHWTPINSFSSKNK